MRNDVPIGDRRPQSSLSDFTGEIQWDEPHVLCECRKALSPSKLPGLDYALNPYGGCSHGCIYCYAPEVTHSEWSEWRVVRVRMNIASRLSREIPPLSGVIGIGTSTDPYQRAEERFGLTRRCLEVISHHDLSVGIMTKSDLVLRDVELLSGMGHSIGITVTTVDDRVSKRTEPGAPLPGRRLAALKELVDSGMNAYVLVGPIMSTVEGGERELADAILETGAKYANIDRLNPRPSLSARLDRMGIGPSTSSVEMVKELLRKGGMRVEDAF